MSPPALRQLRIDELNLPQPRVRSSRRKLHELTASIDEVGVLVPLVVRPLGEREYAVIAGAGRLEALQRLGAKPSTKVPCVVVDVDDAEATLLALVENIVREEMRPFDEAEAARVLVSEYGFTQERVAKALGMGQSTVSQWLSVFELDRSVIAALRDGTIEMRTALALGPLRGDNKAQRDLMAQLRKAARAGNKLSAGRVAALIAARLHEGAIAPVRYDVDGAGRVDAKTTRAGKMRVVLEATDADSLRKLWKSFQKYLT